MQLKSLTVTNVSSVNGPVLYPGYPLSQQTSSAKFLGGACLLRSVRIDIPQEFISTLHLPWAQLKELTTTQSLETNFRSLNTDVERCPRDAAETSRAL
jgi:hypothetical protein